MTEGGKEGAGNHRKQLESKLLRRKGTADVACPNYPFLASAALESTSSTLREQINARKHETNAEKNGRDTFVAKRGAECTDMTRYLNLALTLNFLLPDVQKSSSSFLNRVGDRYRNGFERNRSGSSHSKLLSVSFSDRHDTS